MTLNLSSSQRALGFVGFAATGLALLTAYCQLWSGEQGVPFAVSFSWALVTLASWGVFGFALWSTRRRLADYIERAQTRDLAAAAGLVFAIAVVVAVFSTVALKAWFGDELRLSYLGRRIMTLSPILLLVAVSITAGLAALRWRNRAAQRVAAPPGVEDAGKPDWIELPEAPRLRLRSGDVAVIRTARNYCELEAVGRTFLVRVTAKQLEERLTPLGFARVHRSAIVNLSKVRVVQPEPHGRLNLVMDDGRRLSVSRAYTKTLPHRFRAPPESGAPQRLKSRPEALARRPDPK